VDCIWIFSGCKYYLSVWRRGRGLCITAQRFVTLFHLQKTMKIILFDFSFASFLNQVHSQLCLEQINCNILVICSWSLQIYCMIHGPQLWLLVLSVSAFCLCYPAQPWRLGSILLRVKSIFCSLYLFCQD
jgi:hypothetical protein